MNRSPATPASKALATYSLAAVFHARLGLGLGLGEGSARRTAGLGSGPGAWGSGLGVVWLGSARLSLLQLGLALLCAGLWLGLALWLGRGGRPGPGIRCCVAWLRVARLAWCLLSPGLGQACAQAWPGLFRLGQGSGCVVLCWARGGRPTTQPLFDSWCGLGWRWGRFRRGYTPPTRWPIQGANRGHRPAC